jgi:hypothetical protein
MQVRVCLECRPAYAFPWYNTCPLPLPLSSHAAELTAVLRNVASDAVAISSEGGGGGASASGWVVAVSSSDAGAEGAWAEAAASSRADIVHLTHDHALRRAGVAAAAVAGPSPVLRRTVVSRVYDVFEWLVEPLWLLLVRARERWCLIACSSAYTDPSYCTRMCLQHHGPLPGPLPRPTLQGGVILVMARQMAATLRSPLATAVRYVVMPLALSLFVGTLYSSE